MYKDNTKTTLKKDKVQEINNNEIEELKGKVDLQQLLKEMLTYLLNFSLNKCQVL